MSVEAIEDADYDIIDLLQKKSGTRNSTPKRSYRNYSKDGDSQDS